MIKIDITCPVCHSMKLQFIPEELITELDKKGQDIGLILIPENVICEHLFLVEIDHIYDVAIDFLDCIKIFDEKCFIVKLNSKHCF